MRILIATFANRHSNGMGVGRYYNQIADMFSGVTSKRFAKVFESFKPDAVHIQSETGLGVSARQYCVANSIPYSSAYHTNWDIGMKYWLHMPPALVWSYLRWYYKPSNIIHTATPRLKEMLRSHGIQNEIKTFPLGVDTDIFYPDPDPALLSGYPRPYFMCLSRVAKEKNMEAFLDTTLPGTKFIIGQGPHKNYLQKKYHGKAVFLPYKNVREVLSTGDVFVFPSRFDTFGLSNLEALACGLPIAAYPVMGPIDIIEQGVSGYMSENLEEAALACLSLKKEACIERASQYSWDHTAHEFLKHQVLIV
jgi:glycosyltransferase involved in cell wall biosynthesis